MLTFFEHIAHCVIHTSYYTRFMVIFNVEKMEMLLDAAFKLLEKSGFSIAHDFFLDQFEKHGMEVDRPNHRVVITVEFAHKILCPNPDSARLKKTDKQHFPALHVGGTFPKYYDYKKRQSISGTEEAFIRLTGIFEGMPEIPIIDRIIALSEVPQVIEPVYSTALLIKKCSRPGKGECGTAAVIPYLVELGEIVTGETGSTRCVPPWTFVIPPLKITHEEGEMILQRAKYFKKARGGSMISSGITAPITREGSIVLEIAEVLAVWLCYRLIDPSLALEALFATSVFDMKTGVCVFSHPGAVMQDCAAAQIMRMFFGAQAEVASNYVDAKIPGIQTTYEKLFKLFSVNQFINHMSFDSGLLDAGSTFSPLQAMLDLDMWKSIKAIYPAGPTAPKEFDLQNILGEIDEVLKGPGDFLTTDSTLSLFKDYELDLRFIDRASRKADSTEQAASDAYLSIAQEKLDAIAAHTDLYEAPHEICRAVDQVVKNAKKNLMG